MVLVYDAGANTVRGTRAWMYSTATTTTAASEKIKLKIQCRTNRHDTIRLVAFIGRYEWILASLFRVELASLCLVDERRRLNAHIVSHFVNNFCSFLFHAMESNSYRNNNCFPLAIWRGDDGPLSHCRNHKIVHFASPRAPPSHSYRVNHFLISIRFHFPSMFSFIGHEFAFYDIIIGEGNRMRHAVDVNTVKRVEIPWKSWIKKNSIFSLFATLRLSPALSSLWLSFWQNVLSTLCTESTSTKEMRRKY